MGKKGLTLVELVISVTISGIVLLIVMIFIADSIETVVGSNQKTIVFDSVFDFKDKIGRFSRGGYFNSQLIIDNEPGVGNDVILLQTIDSKQGVIFGVVDSDQLRLESNANYKIYGNKVLGYRTLTEAEIIDIEANPISVYNLDFFPDKLFEGLKTKDFQMDFYNSNSILDINLEILLYYNTANNGGLFSSVDERDLINININL